MLVTTTIITTTTRPTTILLSRSPSAELIRAQLQVRLLIYSVGSQKGLRDAVMDILLDVQPKASKH